MAGEWPIVRLGDVAEVRSGYAFKSAEMGKSGVPLIKIKNITPPTVDVHDVERVPEETIKNIPRIERYKLERRDILIAMTGATVGKVGRFPMAAEAFYLNQRVGKVYLKDTHMADYEFIYYALTQPHYIEQMFGLADGSAQANISGSQIERLEIPLPPLHEQRAIAHILGTLDDKIELNRRMIETLEAMARALFKSWFVDFDPVCAKAEGRDSGLPHPLADLFPDRLVDSDLGEIPAGWGMGRLGDVLEQRMERCDASIETAARPYVPIDCISSKSLFLTEGKPGKEAQSSLTRFYKGDLLFGAMRPYFHKVCIAPFDGTTRTTAFVLFPRTRGDFAFATLLLHHADTIDYATRHSTGSTIPYAVWSNSLEDMPVVVPPSAVREVFDGIVRPVLDRIPEPYFENKTLAALRDTLLPKLISGELRVDHAEKIVAGEVQ